MNQTIKNITPPIIYVFLRKFLMKPRTFSPKWRTLDYDPVKGIQIFFDPAGSWQKIIIDNTYDAFLFKRLLKEESDGRCFIEAYPKSI